MEKAERGLTLYPILSRNPIISGIAYSAVRTPEARIAAMVAALDCKEFNASMASCKRDQRGPNDLASESRTL